jgi:hypothetical protein
MFLAQIIPLGGEGGGAVAPAAVVGATVVAGSGKSATHSLTGTTFKVVHCNPLDPGLVRLLSMNP